MFVLYRVFILTCNPNFTVPVTLHVRDGIGHRERIQQFTMSMLAELVDLDNSCRSLFECDVLIKEDVSYFEQIISVVERHFARKSFVLCAKKRFQTRHCQTK